MTTRLVEATESDATAPVSLYVNAALPDAYDLGAKLKYVVARSQSVAPVLQQRAEEGDSHFHPALRITGRLKGPLDQREIERARGMARVRGVSLDNEQTPGEAVALIVHLAHNPTMVDEALDAAQRGCVDATGTSAVCRAALVIDGGQANLPETEEDFELIVRHVYSAWTQWLSANPEFAALRKRLFIAAPVSIGVALGWLMGHTVTAVPHPYLYDRPGEGTP
ncbi:hypothetical protein [Streptomyces sp. 7-21]|uniref:hypothetical protein n=1 Tax=Streptomyces sp. 7-21 TaxID=2802283 RepID=UPI00191CAD51|nr:hypothetical protein [Streptomyces sp. 7-21]MBL1066548.1 hypothetical protein [Streptomyces sp. 7-21]